MGTAGHVVVWCASVLLLSLSSGCVISRVCMWAFSFLRVIHCVSVLSMPSECCVCAVVCGLILFLPSTVFIRVAPRPMDLHLGKQKHTLQFIEALLYSCVHTRTECVCTCARRQPFRDLLHLQRHFIFSLPEFNSGSKVWIFTWKCALFILKSIDQPLRHKMWVKKCSVLICTSHQG